MSLLAAGAPGIPDIDAIPDRTDLGHGAWIDHCPNWVPGADQWFETMRDCGVWKTAPRPMYDKMVDVPRMVWWEDNPEERVPALADLKWWFEESYCRRIHSITSNWYRDGNDSVAIHRDRFRDLGDTFVAIVSFGGRRKLLVKPDDGGPSIGFSLGHGDLLVMGGTFQATHQHGVPKTSFAEPRISVMFRT